MLRTPFVLAALLIPAQAAAVDYDVNPSNYRDRLGQLGPGDTLRLAAGDYPGLPINGLEGAAGMPIVITGPDTGAPAVITGDPNRNTVSIRDAAYVTLRNFEIDNGGLFVDGVKAEGDASFAHHITVEGLYIHNFGPNQQLVGINTKCPTWDWVIRGNLIEGAGTGLYLGNSNGEEPFVRGVVEYNVVVNPIGYDMQIKHQNPRPTLQGMPTGDSVTIIRHNVFMKYANASMGGDARPNLLVGHWPLSGVGVNDRYEIYGNFFYENASGSEGLFQGEGNIAFYDNVLVNTFGHGASFQAQNDVPKAIDVFSNTVVVAGTGVGIFGADGSFTQTVMGNAVFGSQAFNGGGQRTANVTGSVGEAAGMLVAPNGALGTLNVFPSGAGLRTSGIDLSRFSAMTDYDRDFDGRPRDSSQAGAYGTAGSAAGWMLAEAIKQLDPNVMPPRDGGVVPIDAGFDDAGTPIDAGFRDGGPPRDAGPVDPNRDSGVRDGGEAPDAAPVVGTRGTSGGCGCSAERGGSGGLGLGVFALLALLRRRRDR
ncbi:MAG: MYXO-CTERM sorting domain-containing protein [Deltaproteobacteria bacterium]